RSRRHLRHAVGAPVWWVSSKRRFQNHGRTRGVAMKTQRHKDTEAQKARKKPWLRALCPCVFVSLCLQKLRRSTTLGIRSTFKNREGFMRTRMRLIIVLLLAIWTARAIKAQIASNPIPEPIVKRGIAVEVKDLVRLPDTRGVRPADQDVSPAGWARVSYVRDLPDGRRFANDSRSE